MEYRVGEFLEDFEENNLEFFEFPKMGSVWIEEHWNGSYHAAEADLKMDTKKSKFSHEIYYTSWENLYKKLIKYQDKIEEKACKFFDMSRKGDY